jgi:hypothetical protein
MVPTITSYEKTVFVLHSTEFPVVNKNQLNNHKNKS